MSARFFWLSLASITAAYLLFWFLLIASTATYSTPEAWMSTLMKPEIRYATMLSLITCTVAAGFALLIAIPIGYLMARRQFRGKSLLDAALDIPIVLPPMVIGLCLLIFFQTQIGRIIEGGIERGDWIYLLKKVDAQGNDLGSWRFKAPFSIPATMQFTYTVAGVILAQFVVAAAFAIRTVRGTFDHLSARPEDVALTLGATRLQALWHIALPSARRGLVAAFCIAWARSLGEFGPILVFAGATRNRTEVLPTTVWLELSVGNLESAVAVSLVMILIAIAVLLVVRASGERV
ncbi:ABC transporter permease [Prosthecobacter sp. SYSU 5D2]|uniref:ABC transporter permease n=1 Tax=Prosthecobacter sp. SYSU 5D2 TaxID=3134134 RepID=UPI0031FF3BD6